MITNALSDDAWINSPAKRKIIEDLKAKIDADFKEIDKKKESTTNEVKDKSRDDQDAVRSAVVDTKTQTTALKKILERANTT